jgi:hypothetical protein
MSASLSLLLRQHRQFLPLAFIVKKNLFKEGIDKNKQGCNECRIISFLNNAYLEQTRSVGQ